MTSSLSTAKLTTLTLFFLIGVIITTTSSSSATTTVQIDKENKNDEKTASSASSKASLKEPPTQKVGQNGYDGRIVQSLFRFPASQLGPEFENLFELWYDDWLHAIHTLPPDGNEAHNSTNPSLSSRLPKITPDPTAKLHAARAISSTPSATLFRRQCYAPLPLPATHSTSTTQSNQFYNLYRNLEQRRKEIEFQYIKDPMEEMKLLFVMMRRFYPAFEFNQGDKMNSNNDKGGGRGGGSNAANAANIHKKKSKSNVNTVYSDLTPLNPNSLPFQTTSVSKQMNKGNETQQQQQWTYRPPAIFSSRGTPDNVPFRKKFFYTLHQTLNDPNSTFQRTLRHNLQEEQNNSDTIGNSNNFGKMEMARQSGMFWYPPGGVREWHSNYLDLVGNTKKEKGDKMNASQSRDEEIFKSQVWRMYFVRTVRDEEFDNRLDKLRRKKKEHGLDDSGGVGVSDAVTDHNVGDVTTNMSSLLMDQSPNDHSAMHIIPGIDSGITLEVLQNAGARLLTEGEKKRQWSDVFDEDDAPIDSIYTISTTGDNEGNGGVKSDQGNEGSAGSEETDKVEFNRNAVWRIPDQDGYVTLFRLPDIWHCIVSEEVHRYSLGFAFSDREVRALLTVAGIDFDVDNGNVENVENLGGGDKDHFGGSRDEL